VGKIQFTGILLKWLGRLEWGNTATYLDGLPFARLLLVTGLPQGPFWVNASVAGSPGGGNRTEYALAWNLRLTRSFPVAGRPVRAGVDTLNVTNARNSTLELDASGLGFNRRLPAAIEPARSVRVFLELRF
jgi:hypothetical protein